MSDLDARLIAAHEAGDNAALVELYTQAAASAETETQQAFYLTHAYVFALEAGLDAAADLHAGLKAMGREE